MELALRDKIIQKMESELINRKRILSKQLKSLVRTSNENVFLSSVKNDYTYTYNTLIEDKRKQCQALERLSSYISNITSDIQMTESLLRETRTQQTQLLEEIAHIRSELNELVDP